MTSSMENRPEPLHLYAQHVEGPPGQADGAVRVIHGDGSIVAQATPLDFVKVTIEALKMLGHDHDTQVIIQGVSGNPAFNGAIKHHQA
jgi:hypothetical protein